MAEYGVTDKGFVIKRLDTIMEEIHTDLTEAFGFDTRLTKPSFLDTLITTFSYQIADLWETAQNNYYAKYPATATGVNLDNAVQYGGIRRSAAKQSTYLLHCTGNDGTYVREEAVVATNTNPEIRLRSAGMFQITRESCNSAEVCVSVSQIAVYSITINGNQYSYSSEDGNERTIIEGLKEAIKDTEYTVTIEEGNILRIEDNEKTRSNTLILSDNLTTRSVTTIAQFLTEDYGKVVLPAGIVTKMVNNIAGFQSVTNLIEPTYGRLTETDIELRQSYIAKSALRSNTMIGSIIAELLNNVANVESASGYENETDYTDERGLPPHSIEIIVEGGDDTEIAHAILMRKAGGIQTYGSVVIDVPGDYEDTIPIRFNRPEYLYTWLRIVLHGDSSKLPTNYAQLTKESLLADAAQFRAGTSLLTQLLTDGIYSAVSGITYIDVYTAYEKDSVTVPQKEEYQIKNIIVTSRQKVLVSEARIEVEFSADS